MLRALLRLGEVFSNREEAERAKVSTDEARIPQGYRAYIVGDIHGRADLLRELLQRVTEDLRASSAHNYLVFLGDYIDRGHQSREVIDLIIDFAHPGLEVVTLAGNHEEAMLGFMDDPMGGSDWLKYGGDATLHSYGVSVPPGVPTPEKIKRIIKHLEAMLPDEHLDFLSGLDDWFELGDYMFVHAGIDPGRSLSRQDPRRTRWMREPFLSYSGLYEKVIVHGHTVTNTPQFFPNRISIDTGAYYSGNLSCIVLENDEVRIL